MACPGSPCSPAPSSAGTWTFTANPSANRFCDDRLIGLAASDASAGTTLVAVDPITGCITRPAGPKGVWQHDPDGCLPDFFGPLSNPDFCGILAANPSLSQRIPMLQGPADCGNETVSLVSQAAENSQTGLLALIQRGACAGSVKWATAAPEVLLNGRENAAGTCVSPRVIGYVSRVRTIAPGITVTEQELYSIDQWQQATVSPVLETDLLEAESPAVPNLQLAAWRTETCPNGGTVKQLVGMDAVQLKRIISPGRTIFLEPPELVYSQIRSTAPYGAIAHFPALGPASPPPIISNGVIVNLTTLPGYTADATAVRLSCSITANTVTQLFDVVLVINGREYCRVPLPGDNAGGSSSNQIEIPIPANKLLPVDFYYQLVTAGTLTGMVAQVWVDAFVIA